MREAFLKKQAEERAAEMAGITNVRICGYELSVRGSEDWWKPQQGGSSSKSTGGPSKYMSEDEYDSPGSAGEETDEENDMKRPVDENDSRGSAGKEETDGENDAELSELSDLTSLEDETESVMHVDDS